MPQPITVEPFPIPGYYRQIYGIAIDRDRVAAVWLAFDDERDVAFAHSEHSRSRQAHPAVHAQAIKARGRWPGMLAGWGSAEVEGEELLRTYKNLGLLLSAATNVGKVAENMWARLKSGRLLVFRTCEKLINELSGLPGPLMCATACAVSGLGIAALRPREQWSCELMGLPPEARHKAQYEPFRELYAGIEPPPRSNAPRRN
jgi:hypothetical protein